MHLHQGLSAKVRDRDAQVAPADVERGEDPGVR
jgi:hypothetical protein